MLYKVISLILEMAHNFYTSMFSCIEYFFDIFCAGLASDLMFCLKTSCHYYVSTKTFQNLLSATMANTVNYISNGLKHSKRPNEYFLTAERINNSFCFENMKGQASSLIRKCSSIPCGRMHARNFCF